MSLAWLIAALAGALAGGLTWLFSNPESRCFILDEPTPRSLHQHPTPRSGGIAIVLALVAGGVTAWLALRPSPMAAWIGLGAVLVAAISFADDRLSVPPGYKLGVQLLATWMLIGVGLRPETLSLPGLELSWPVTNSTVFTLLLLLWMTNLYNFMDGIDGLAAGMTVLGFGTFAALGWCTSHLGFSTLNLVVAATAAGFLVWNFPPAHVFMGDLGSSTLGFLAGAFSLWATWAQIFPLWVAGLVFSPFIVDATVTLLRRLTDGERVWQAHKSHFYQRLVQLGWGHRKTTLAGYVLMALCGGSALLAFQLPPRGQWGIVITWGLIYLGLMGAVGIGELRQQEAISMPQLAERLGSRTAIILHDLCMAAAAWLGAYWFRFNLGSIPEPFFETAWMMLPPLLGIQAGAFRYFGLHRGLWRFTSLPDLTRIVRAVIAGLALFTVAAFLLTRMEGMPRSALPLYGLLLVPLLVGPRFAYRYFKFGQMPAQPGERTLIVGTGKASELLVRELLQDPQQGYAPIALVDDDPSKLGKEIHGIRVVGQCRSIPQIVEEQAIDLILIALPASAGSQQLRRVVELCEGTGIPFRMAPRLKDLMAGRASYKELREVSIEDLLGRDPIALDWDILRTGLANKRVLITGAGGSIGSELSRQIARLNPEEMVVLDKSEANLYNLETELAQSFPQVAHHPILLDVCDRHGVEHVLRCHLPQVVFHAAACKQVPILERQVREAVRNNVVGTRVLAEAAVRAGVERFIQISTDKAVNPTSVMGATKRVAEMFCQNFPAPQHTGFITVRFGNVLDSKGSVVPRFRQQIAAGGPVTVTHPEVTRYFMTLSEAAQLILQAAAMGGGGEIFVLDMGEPIEIRYLAEQMIQLSGRVPREEIRITYTGLRPGEKLHEELFHTEEWPVRTQHAKILRADSRWMASESLAQALDTLEQACAEYDETRLRALLRRVVAEYHSIELRPTGSDRPNHEY